MKVKICGITNVADAQRAADLGADFLGFIFVRESPRFLDFETAASIAANVRGPQFVGVFRDAELEQMQNAPVDLIQLHGGESEDVVRALHKPTIKAISIVDALPDTDTHADWLLFDSKGGGTGRVFDWTLLDGAPRTKPFFLAGGLNPDNVADAIRRVRPDGIDVSSGVESRPGIKDHDKLKLLFERVK